MQFSKLLPATFVLLGLGAQLSGSALAQFSDKKFSGIQPSSLNNSGELVVDTEANIKVGLETESAASEAAPFSTVDPAMLTDESELPAPIGALSTVQPNVLVGEGSLDDSEDQLKLDNGVRLDHFKFGGEAGEQITITGESSDFNIVVGLFLVEEEQLKEIAINDNASETTTNAKIETTLSDTGTYAIIVAPAFSDGQGDYVITLDGVGES